MSKVSPLRDNHAHSAIPRTLWGRFERIVRANPLLALSLTLLLTSLVFSFVTNHAWEDGYITYRSSKNLALGYGLVYDLGERVHSFTSPLGTLLPAAIRFGFVESDDGVLWIFRIIQCGALGFTGLLLWGIGRQFRLSKWPFVFFLGMFAIDSKTLDFSTNGMETGFFVFFVALTAYSVIVPLAKSEFIMGLAWAGFDVDQT